MNKRGIIKSISTPFLTQWQSSINCGIDQILLSVVMCSFCGIYSNCRLSSFTSDVLVRELLKLNKAINDNAISTALKNLGQSGARKLQSFLLSKNVLWLKERGHINNYDMDAVQFHEIYKQRSIKET